jgi:putative ABC transport system permease protein
MFDFEQVPGHNFPSLNPLGSRHGFCALPIISFFMAAPLAWFGMHKWLQSYTYRIEIQWWVFALAGLLSVLIALLTVGYQSIKAAVANPAKSLRAE